MESTRPKQETATIEFVADEVARRFDEVHMRTEDRLNDSYLKRVIAEKVTEVLTAVALPMRQTWGAEDLPTEHDAHRHDFAVDRMRAILEGRNPVAASAILGELFAGYLAGFPPALREGAMNGWLDLVRDLVPIMEKKVFGPGGYPFNQKKAPP